MVGAKSDTKGRSLETVGIMLGSHDRDRLSRNDGSWDGFKSGSVVWDHYQGLVLQDGLGSKEHLSENGGGQEHSGWVEKKRLTGI